MDNNKSKELSDKYIDDYFEKVKDKATHNKYNEDFEEYLKLNGYTFDEYVEGLLNLLESENEKYGPG